MKVLKKLKRGRCGKLTRKELEMKKIPYTISLNQIQRNTEKSRTDMQKRNVGRRTRNYGKT
jgi:hypothetical protein